MGSSLSGNYGGRPTVESGLKLNIGMLMRDGLARPGFAGAGMLRWTNVTTGEESASMGYYAFLGQERGYIQLQYMTTNHRTGEKRPANYRIELATTPQPFGGRRWWFRCPRRGDLVSKLYLPPGALTFASRRAFRIAYASQRQSPHDRALSQAFKRRDRLGADGGIGDPIWKPTGMRWKTFDRKMAKIDELERRVNARLTWFVAKLSLQGARP